MRTARRRLQPVTTVPLASAVLIGGHEARTRARRLAGAVAILVATALAVILAQGWFRDSDRVGATPSPTGTPTPASPSFAGPVLLSGTDNAYLQLMIPMNEGVLALADHLDATPGTDPALRAVAGRLRATHQSELLEMRALLVAGDMPETDVHEGHQMPGMVTAERLASLRQAPAAEAGPRAVELLRAHLTQSIVVSTAEREAGGSAEAKALADRMRQARVGELAELDTLPAALTAGH